MGEQWILDITNRVQHPDNRSNEGSYIKSIYRVPKFLKDNAERQSYEPKLASFGPYHHGSPDLCSMEQHKDRALIRYLNRIVKFSKTLNDVVIAMRKVESRLLASYDSLDIDEEFGHERRQCREWLKERDEFLKLMIVDGCFALEFMLASSSSTDDEQDPIFSKKRNLKFSHILERDMLLLENQIPLLALFTLASIEGSGVQDVTKLIRDFYKLPSPSPDTNQCSHILDLYRKIMTAEGMYLLSSSKNIQSATELKNAGISFCKSNSKSFKDISFNDGVLSLPEQLIDDDTESIFLNLMAFEFIHVTAGTEVTAYLTFMDGLIDNANDVALLKNEEIINGWISSDDENIANMFNRITKDLTVLSYYHDENQENVNEKLNIYCKKRMNRWRASFIHTYLKNPWVFISLLGALFLLSLAIVQTIYTILQYYNL